MSCRLRKTIEEQMTCTACAEFCRSEEKLAYEMGVTDRATQGDAS